MTYKKYQAEFCGSSCYGIIMKKFRFLGDLDDTEGSQSLLNLINFIKLKYH